jgi:hypothetical protein
MTCDLSFHERSIRRAVDRVIVIEELKLGFGHSDEGECDASKPLVNVIDNHQHGGLAKNAMHGWVLDRAINKPSLSK